MYFVGSLIRSAYGMRLREVRHPAISAGSRIRRNQHLSLFLTITIELALLSLSTVASPCLTTTLHLQSLFIHLKRLLSNSHRWEVKVVQLEVEQHLLQSLDDLFSRVISRRILQRHQVPPPTTTCAPAEVQSHQITPPTGNLTRMATSQWTPPPSNRLVHLFTKRRQTGTTHLMLPPHQDLDLVPLLTRTLILGCRHRSNNRA